MPFDMRGVLVSTAGLLLLVWAMPGSAGYDHCAAYQEPLTFESGGATFYVLVPKEPVVVGGGTQEVLHWPILLYMESNDHPGLQRGGFVGAVTDDEGPHHLYDYQDRCYEQGVRDGRWVDSDTLMAWV